MLSKKQVKEMREISTPGMSVICDGIISTKFTAYDPSKLTLETSDITSCGSIQFFENGIIITPGSSYVVSGVKTGLPYMPQAGHDKYILAAANRANLINGVYGQELARNDGKRKKPMEWLETLVGDDNTQPTVTGELVYAGSTIRRQGIIISINGERYSTKLRDAPGSGWILIPSSVTIGDPYHTFLSRCLSGQSATVGLYTGAPYNIRQKYGPVGSYDYTIAMPDTGTGLHHNVLTTGLVARFASVGSNVEGHSFYEYDACSGISVGSTATDNIEQLGLDSVVLSFVTQSTSKFPKDSIMPELFKRITDVIAGFDNETALTFSEFFLKLIRACNVSNAALATKEISEVVELHKRFFGGPPAGSMFKELAVPGAANLPGPFWLYGSRVDRADAFSYDISEIHAFVSGELITFKGKQKVDFANAIFARGIVCTEDFLKTTEQYKAVAALRAKRCKPTLLSDVPLQHPDTLAKLLNYTTPGILCYELGDAFDDREFNQEKPIDLAAVKARLNWSENTEANTTTAFYERIRGEDNSNIDRVELGTVAGRGGMSDEKVVTLYRDRVRELYFTDVAHGMPRNESLENILGAKATGEEIGALLNMRVRVDDTPDSIVLSHQAHRYMRGRSLSNITPGCLAMGAMNAKKSKGLLTAILSTLINMQKVSKS